MQILYRLDVHGYAERGDYLLARFNAIQWVNVWQNFSGGFNGAKFQSHFAKNFSLNILSPHFSSNIYIFNGSKKRNYLHSIHNKVQYTYINEVHMVELDGFVNYINGVIFFWVNRTIYKFIEIQRIASIKLRCAVLSCAVLCMALLR